MSRRATCAGTRSAPAPSNLSTTSRTNISKLLAIRITGAGPPYLDGIEYTIIPNRSTAILAFIAGNFDMTFPYEVTIPLLKDIKTQAPQATCEIGMAIEPIRGLVNRTVEPFDHPDLRPRVALTLRVN